MFRKQLEQVEDQGLSNLAGTKTIDDRVCVLDAPNSGQNLTSTSSVTSSHRSDLCRNFEINSVHCVQVVLGLLKIGIFDVQFGEMEIQVSGLHIRRCFCCVVLCLCCFVLCCVVSLLLLMIRCLF